MDNSSFSTTVLGPTASNVPALNATASNSTASSTEIVPGSVSASSSKVDFDRNIRKFFKFLKKITNESLCFNMTSEIKDFMSLYEKEDQSEFENIFLSILKTYSVDIEKRSDSWLRNNSIEINYKKVKLSLSKIYLLCNEIKQSYASKLSGLIKDMKVIKEKYKQFIYPDIFLLHMYRIFSSLSDSKNLKDICQQIEREILGETSQPQIPNINFVQLIPQVINSPATKSLLNTMINKIDVSQCNDNQSLMDQILKVTSDPELLSNFDALFKTMFNTIDPKK